MSLENRIDFAQANTWALVRSGFTPRMNHKSTTVPHKKDHSFPMIDIRDLEESSCKLLQDIDPLLAHHGECNFP